MIVNSQKSICIEKTCHCWIDRHDLIKAVLWYTDKPVVRVKKIFMHGKYPAVSIHDKKIHVHRLLMSWKMNRILKRDEYVHHKDENPINNYLNNLEIQTPAKHQSIANKGRKQTKEHILKRADATTKTRYGHSIYENKELLK